MPKTEPPTDVFPEWCYRAADPSPVLVLRGAAVGSPQAWRAKRAEILARVNRILGHPSSGSVALEPQVLEERRYPCFIRSKVRYQVQPGDAVTAYLMVPRKRTRAAFPAVLCLHQTISSGKCEPAGLDGSSTLHYARHLAGLGFITLSPDSVTAGERSPRRPGLRPYDTAEFHDEHPNWSAVGKIVWDSRCAVDYLQTLGDVDRRRIGCIGHSHGGLGTLFSMAFDERLAAGVSSCGFAPFAGDPHVLHWARKSWYIYFKKLRACFLRQELPFDLHEVLALVAPRPFLNLSGVGDIFFPNSESVRKGCEEVRRVYALLGVERRFSCVIHQDGHAFRAAARRLAYDWLGRHLRHPV